MKPILVTGVGGSVGGVGQKIVENLLSRNIPFRAFIRKTSALSESLKDRGAEIAVGNLTDLQDMHRAMKGVETLYFGMGVSPQYLEATMNAAAVAKHHEIKAFVNMSQMTVSQMSITETTTSPQQKLHWLSEQALHWSGLPVVNVRPTAFLENPLFNQWAFETIFNNGEIRLPFGEGKTSPIAASDVAFAITEILLNPAKHVGHVYELTGVKSRNMFEIAQDYSRALGRDIKYVDLPFAEWKTNDFASKGFPDHVGSHLATMALLHRHNRYDRSSDDFKTITGVQPMSVETWARAKRGDLR